MIKEALLDEAMFLEFVGRMSWALQCCLIHQSHLHSLLFMQLLQVIAEVPRSGGAVLLLSEVGKGRIWETAAVSSIVSVAIQFARRVRVVSSPSALLSLR